MTDTSLIDEVRATRHRIALECGNDLLEIAKRAADATRRFRNAKKTQSLKKPRRDLMRRTSAMQPV